jgi:regulator of replication initiation timing
MTSGRAKSSYVVKFAQTEADQDLLQAVERALEGQTYRGFSDLCKQALRLMLLSTEPTVILPMLAVLEQQVMTLQLQVMQLEQRSREPHSSVQALATQLQQLTDRLSQLEQKVDTAVQPAPVEEPEPETDPLLSRLAPLLEDF